MPDFGERTFWYGVTLVGLGTAALLTPQLSIYQRILAWLLVGLGSIILLRIEWPGIQALLQRVNTKVGASYSNASLVIVSVTGAILGATLLGGIWWVLPSQSPSNATSAFGLDFGMVNLKDPADIRFATPPTPTGTFAFLIVRVRNLSVKPDTVRDWNFSATAIDGANYPAEPVVVLGSFNIPVAEPDSKVRPWILSPADDLIYKATQPIGQGGIIEGYLLFWFADVPRETLHIPGTLFTLKCKDTYSDIQSQAVFKW